MSIDYCESEEGDEEDNPALAQLNSEAWTAYSSDDYELAIELFETTLQDAQREEATIYIASATAGLGISLMLQNQSCNRIRAKRLLEQADILAHNLEFSIGTYVAASGLARIATQQRRWKLALGYIQKAKRAADGEKQRLETEFFLAELAWRTRHFRFAKRLYHKCALSYQDFSDWLAAADCWRRAAILASKCRDYDQSLSYINTMLSCSEKLESERLARIAILNVFLALRRHRRREMENILITMREFGQEKETRWAARICLPFVASTPGTCWHYVRSFWRGNDGPE